MVVDPGWRVGISRWRAVRVLPPLLREQDVSSYQQSNNKANLVIKPTEQPLLSAAGGCEVQGGSAGCWLPAGWMCGVPVVLR